MSKYQLTLGDCLVEMKKIADASIDSCVCDPPYELGMMNQNWDRSGIAYNVAMWKEVYRILKPGAHLLSFGGTRTYHRMACAIEDAGFEIRDSIRYMGEIHYPAWVYASGMPKSLNVSKALGKTKGLGLINPDQEFKTEWDVTVPATDAAKRRDGWGTNLAPAWEPICVARKPLTESTIAANVLRHGTGAINIDACRIGVDDKEPNKRNATGVLKGTNEQSVYGDGLYNHTRGATLTQGRWPKNVILDGSEEVLAEFAKYGESKGHSIGGNGKKYLNSGVERGWGFKDGTPTSQYLDAGTAARFFFHAKASKSERGEGNTHPTVKPLALMKYLCRLVTQPGGAVLDPFAGSGSTGVAALREGFNFVGIELIESHYDIAIRRLEDASRAASGQPKQLSGNATDYAALPMFSEMEPTP